MTDRILICGPCDGPDYQGINSPTGRCKKHGDYLYYCGDCQYEWESARADAEEGK